MKHFSLKTTALLLSALFSGFTLSACSNGASGSGGDNLSHFTTPSQPGDTGGNTDEDLGDSGIVHNGDTGSDTPSGPVSSDPQSGWSSNQLVYNMLPKGTAGDPIFAPATITTLKWQCQLNKGKCGTYYDENLDYTEVAQIADLHDASPINIMNTYDKAVQDAASADNFEFGFQGSIVGSNEDLTLNIGNKNDDKAETRKVGLSIDAKGLNTFTLGPGFKANIYNSKIDAKQLLVQVDYLNMSQLDVSGDFVLDGDASITAPISSTTSPSIDASQHVFPDSSKFKIYNFGGLNIVSVPVSITVHGKYTQKSGALNAQFGTLYAEKGASLSGSVKVAYDPTWENIATIAVLSPGDIELKKGFRTQYIRSNKGYEGTDNNLFESLSAFPAPAQKVQYNNKVYQAYLMFPGGTDTAIITPESVISTMNVFPRPVQTCDKVCETSAEFHATKDDSTSTTADLQSKLPTEESTRNIPNIVFNKAISGNDDVVFKSPKKHNNGVAGVVFNGDFSANSLTLNDNTQVVFNGVNVQGDVTLNGSKAGANVYLMAHGVINGNVNNTFGLFYVEQYAKTVYDMFNGSNMPRNAFVANYLGAKNAHTPLLSWPVGVVINGDYTQQSDSRKNPLQLMLDNSVLYVSGKVNLYSGVILQTYGTYRQGTAENPQAQYAFLLIVSPNKINFNKWDAHVAHKIPENYTWIQDQAEVVKLNDRLYGLIVVPYSKGAYSDQGSKPSTGESSTSSDESSSASSNAASSESTQEYRAQGVHSANAGLMGALGKVKDDTVTVQAVDSKATYNLVRPSSLGLLRERLMAMPATGLTAEEQAMRDALTGTYLGNLNSAAQRMRLMLDNKAVVGLLTGVSHAPNPNGVRVQVGFDTNLILGKGQLLSTSNQLHLRAQQGAITGRVAVNYVTIEQNPHYSDKQDQKAKDGELSHTKGYGLQAGVAVALPQVKGMSVAANFSYERFNHKVKFAALDNVESKFDSSALSVSLLASQNFNLGALMGSNDLLQVQLLMAMAK